MVESFGLVTAFDGTARPYRSGRFGDLEHLVRQRRYVVRQPTDERPRGLLDRQDDLQAARVPDRQYLKPDRYGTERGQRRQHVPVQPDAVARADLDGETAGIQRPGRPVVLVRRPRL